MDKFYSYQGFWEGVGQGMASSAYTYSRGQYDYEYLNNAHTWQRDREHICEYFDRAKDRLDGKTPY
jgi:hypothetical protein